MAIERILFSLLRLALGTSAEVPDFTALTKADWQKLIDLSFDQGVAALSVDGYGSTGSPTENEGLGALDSPELEDLKYEWFASAFDAELHNNNVSARARGVYEFFAEGGLQ